MTQTSFARMLPGFAGQRHGIDHYAITGVNDKGAAAEVIDITIAALVAQVSTIDVSGNESDGDYTVTINGVAHTFAASTSTATEIRDGLISAINGGVQPVTAVLTDADSFTVTADAAGVPYTISIASPSSDLTLTATTPNGGEGTLYEASVGGVAFGYTGLAGDTLADIRDGLISAFRAQVGFEDAASANPYSTNKIRVTAKTAGTSAVVAESSSYLSLTTTTANGSPESIPFGAAVVKGTLTDRSVTLPSEASQILMGLVERIHHNTDPRGVIANNLAAPFQDLSIGRKGRWLVPVEVAIAYGDAVYFRHTASGTKVPGGWGNVADSATADLVAAAKWVSSAAAGGMAIVELNLP